MSEEKLICIFCCGCYSKKKCRYNIYYESRNDPETTQLGSDCKHPNAHPGILEQQTELESICIGPKPVTDVQIAESNQRKGYLD